MQTSRVEQVLCTSSFLLLEAQKALERLLLNTTTATLLFEFSHKQ